MVNNTIIDILSYHLAPGLGKKKLYKRSRFLEKSKKWRLWFEAEISEFIPDKPPVNYREGPLLKNWLDLSVFFKNADKCYNNLGLHTVYFRFIQMRIVVSLSGFKWILPVNASHW